MCWDGVGKHITRAQSPPPKPKKSAPRTKTTRVTSAEAAAANPSKPAKKHAARKTAASTPAPAPSPRPAPPTGQQLQAALMAALKAGTRPSQGSAAPAAAAPAIAAPAIAAPAALPPLARGASVPPQPVNVARPVVSPRANGASPHSASNVATAATPTSATGSNATPTGKAAPVVAVQLVPGHPAPPGYHVARKPDGTLVLVSDAQVQMAKLAAQHNNF